jgi:hypothetical protein
MSKYNLLLPQENFHFIIFFSGCPVICMDMGHLVFQQSNNKEELMVKILIFNLIILFLF